MSQWQQVLVEGVSLVVMLAMSGETVQVGQEEKESVVHGRILGKVTGKVVAGKETRKVSLVKVGASGVQPKVVAKVPETTGAPVANGGRRGGHGISGNLTDWNSENQLDPWTLGKGKGKKGKGSWQKLPASKPSKYKSYETEETKNKEAHLGSASDRKGKEKGERGKGVPLSSRPKRSAEPGPRGCSMARSRPPLAHPISFPANAGTQSAGQTACRDWAPAFAGEEMDGRETRAAPEKRPAVAALSQVDRNRR